MKTMRRKTANKARRRKRERERERANTKTRGGRARE